MFSRRALLGAALASLSATLGGATVVLTRYLMPETDPFSLPMARYGIGALVLLSLLFITGKAHRKILVRDGPVLALLTIVYFCAFPWAFARGVEETTAARAGIVYTSMPLMTLVLGSLIGIERMTWRKVLAVVIAVAGIGVTMSDEVGAIAPDAWRGDLFMALAALFCALHVLFSRPYIARYGGFVLTVWTMLAGSLMMLPLALVFGEPFSGSLDFNAEGWMVLLLLAIPGAALMTLIYVIAIPMTTPTGVTMTVGFNPLSAIVLGALILGEPITPRIGIGFACIICAVVLANLERSGPPSSIEQGGRLK